MMSLPTTMKDIFGIFKTGRFGLLHTAVKVQECDATMLNSITKAW